MGYTGSTLGCITLHAAAVLCLVASSSSGEITPLGPLDASRDRYQLSLHSSFLPDPLVQMDSPGAELFIEVNEDDKDDDFASSRLACRRRGQRSLTSPSLSLSRPSFLHSTFYLTAPKTGPPAL